MIIPFDKNYKSNKDNKETLSLSALEKIEKTMKFIGTANGIPESQVVLVIKKMKESLQFKVLQEKLHEVENNEL